MLLKSCFLVQRGNVPWYRCISNGWTKWINRDRYWQSFKWQFWNSHYQQWCIHCWAWRDTLCRCGQWQQRRGWQAGLICWRYHGGYYYLCHGRQCRCYLRLQFTLQFRQYTRANDQRRWCRCQWYGDFEYRNLKQWQQWLVTLWHGPCVVGT